MIVCSCNIVSHLEIEAAVEDLVSADANVMLTPGMVYRAIGVRPKCGTCLKHVAALIHAHRDTITGGRKADTKGEIAT